MGDTTEDNRAVHIDHGTGVQVGEHNMQVNHYTYLAEESDGRRRHVVTASGTFDSPYPGLDSFGEKDAAFFFGRDEQIQEILDRLRGRLSAPRPLVVSGVSGAGKSSLLSAGVLPRIDEAGLCSAPGRPWPILTMTPGRSPVAELAARLAKAVNTSVFNLRNALLSRPDNLSLALRQAILSGTLGAQGPLLLVVDQFEEVFTQCEDEAERRAFIAALHAAATIPQGPKGEAAAVVLIGVRADFEARCHQHDELAPAIQDRYLLGAMTPLQLRLAITEPARVAGSSVEPALVEELLRALSQLAKTDGGPSGAGLLPHLSHALDQAWRSRAGHTLTLADYEFTGGIEGSIAASADRAFKALTPAQQEIAQPIFMRLVTTSSELIVSAGKATWDELAAIGPAADEQAIIEAFAKERLLTVDSDHVEISHEALLRSWGQFRSWLDTDTVDVARYSRVAADAREWTASGQKKSYLYQPDRMTEVDEAVRRWESAPNRYPAPGPEARSFLQASRAAARATRGRRRAIIASLSALALGASGAAAVASHQTTVANQQRATALSQAAAAQALAVSDSTVGDQLAVTAWHASHSSQAATVMSTLLARQFQAGELGPAGPELFGGSIPQLAFSGNGGVLAAVNPGDDGDAVQLWNTLTGQPVSKAFDTGEISGLALSSNGGLLATLGVTSDVKLWNAKTGQSLASLPRTAGSTAVAFGSGGRLTAIGSGSDIQIWDTEAVQQAHTLQGSLTTGSINALAFSPDGSKLAAATSNGYVTLWSTSTWTEIGSPLGGGSAKNMSGVAFSPNGARLAAVDTEGYAHVWDLATGAAVQPFLVDPEASAGTGSSTDTESIDPDLTGPSFSPDGTQIATTASDGSVHLWNPLTGASDGTLSVNPATATSPGPGLADVAFSSTGMLASIDFGDNVRLWNLNGGQPDASRPIGAPLSTTGSSFVSYNATPTMLGSGTDGYISSWSAAVIHGTVSPPGSATQDRMPTIWADSKGDSLPVAISPDGTMGAITTGSGTPAAGAMYFSFHPRVPHQVSVGAGKYVSLMAFSPDDRFFATVVSPVKGSSSAGDTVKLWNVASAAPAAQFTTSAPVTSLAFSHDGTLVATGQKGGTITVWSTGGGAAQHTLRAAGNGVGPLAFAPSGDTLAAVDGDQVDLWDAATGQRAGTLPGINGTQRATALAYSPDGKTLAVGYENGTAQLWDTATGTTDGGLLPAATPKAKNGQSIAGLSFSADGTMLVSLDQDGVATPWPTALFTDPYAALCAEVGVMSAKLWSEYMPGQQEPTGTCSDVSKAS